MSGAGRVRARISISLDGYAAGPNQSVEHPLGEGGMRPHEWAFKPGRDISIGGGASTINQYLAPELLDELQLNVVPGERLFEDVGDRVLEPVEAVASPDVTHIRYRVSR